MQALFYLQASFRWKKTHLKRYAALMKDLLLLGAVLILFVAGILYKVATGSEKGSTPNLTSNQGMVTFGTEARGKTDGTLLAAEKPPSSPPALVAEEKEESPNLKETEQVRENQQPSTPWTQTAAEEGKEEAPEQLSKSSSQLAPPEEQQEEPLLTPQENLTAPPLNEEEEPADRKQPISEEESYLTPGGNVAYKVKSGDTLYGIVRRAYGQADRDLVMSVSIRNDMSNPSDLQIDQDLVLPNLDGYPAPKKP